MITINDFITRFNNHTNNNNYLKLLNSKKIKEILIVLAKSKRLQYKIINETNNELTIQIVNSSINKLKIISKPSLKKYISYKNLLTNAELKESLVFYILTNSDYGYITSYDAINKKVGGKLLVLVK